MQNETFEFRFHDKSGLDEKSFFLFFMPHLSRPEEKPSGMSPIIEAAIAAMRGDKELPPRKDEYSPTPDTFYSATYDLSNGGLEVNVLTTIDDPNAKPGTLHIRSSEGDTTTVVDGMDGVMRHEPLAGDAWEVFYRHATFDEILGSIDPDGGDSVLLKMCKFEACGEEDDEKVKHALQIIRDDPKWLLHEEIALKLMETLEKARWSTDRKEATKALGLLKDHLLPTRPGGKIPLPPNIEGIRAVMEALAKDLSTRCKDGAFRGFLYRGEEIDENLYDELTEWAKKNREFRVSRLSRQELNTLILKPKTFVNDLLERHFRSSIKTMSRNNA
jgi:hypothetical protein